MRQLIFLFLAIALIPVLSLANGGDQRVIENKYLINLSRAPFTPRVGVKTSFLASFMDIQKNKLISEDLIVGVRISKLGDAPKGKFIFEQNNISVKGGVFDFPYTFTDAGLHEIFFDFTFVSNQEKTYNAPDFLVDIQQPEIQPQTNRQTISWVVGGMALGFIGGWLLQSRFRTDS